MSDVYLKKSDIVVDDRLMWYNMDRISRNT